MKTIINTQNIQTFIQQIPTITNKLETVGKTMENYVDHLKQNKLISTTQETYEQEYQRKEEILNKLNNKEGQLDKLEMTMKERDEVTNQSKQTIETLTLKVPSKKSGKKRRNCRFVFLSILCYSIFMFFITYF